MEKECQPTKLEGGRYRWTPRTKLPLCAALKLMEKYLQVPGRKIQRWIGVRQTIYKAYSSGRNRSADTSFYELVKVNTGIDLFQSHLKGKLVIINNKILSQCLAAFGVTKLDEMDDAVLYSNMNISMPLSQYSIGRRLGHKSTTGGHNSYIQKFAADRKLTLSQTLLLLESYMQVKSCAIYRWLGIGHNYYSQYATDTIVQGRITFYDLVKEKMGIDLYQSQLVGKLIISDNDSLTLFESGVGTRRSQNMGDWIQFSQNK